MLSSRWTTSSCSSLSGYVLHNKLHPVTCSNTEKSPWQSLPPLWLPWSFSCGLCTENDPLNELAEDFFCECHVTWLLVAWEACMFYINIQSGIKGLQGVLLHISPIIKQGRGWTWWGVFLSDQKVTKATGSQFKIRSHAWECKQIWRAIFHAM